MHRVSLLLFSTVLCATAVQAEELELSGVPFNLQAGNEVLATAKEVSLSLVTLLPANGERTPKAWRDGLKQLMDQQDIVFDGDSVELAFRLNSVTSFQGLAGIEKPVSLVVKRDGDLSGKLSILLDTELKRTVMKGLAEVRSGVKAFSEIGNSPPELADQLPQIAATYGAYMDVISQATKPLSILLLQQLDSETTFLDGALSKLQAGDKLDDLQLSAIKTIASDNVARLGVLAEPLGADRDQAKGNNGSFRMEVSLWSYDKGKKTQKDGYRVRYHPVARTIFDDFPTFTTPATAFVPEASLCIVAVDPKTGRNVSDTFFGSMESLALDPEHKVDLTFTTKPASNSRCEK
ncbi:MULTISPECIES: hypothetical protein [Rhizobium]|uniref:Uncharacterized protein n=1 Tax=Rhizobium aouanii TaxID=3118145 RepID=A0ABU8CKT4_9HYPH|nr:hypothetical protein [Rhizobium acaciae]MCW1410732.1 hypothetical protein [Rhizobium acaciae]MCW1742969.1 hypothetical protein [Rhizobium acaciae]MCW1750165.1 hypothetical protein [Rhizobium acaciae]